MSLPLGVNLTHIGKLVPTGVNFDPLGDPPSFNHMGKKTLQFIKAEGQTS
jgi:hypothetical protein